MVYSNKNLAVETFRSFYLSTNTAFMPVAVGLGPPWDSLPHTGYY